MSNQLINGEWPKKRHRQWPVTVKDNIENGGNVATEVRESAWVRHL
jgi:hypothetical protein